MHSFYKHKSKDVLIVVGFDYYMYLRIIPTYQPSVMSSLGTPFSEGWIDGSFPP